MMARRYWSSVFAVTTIVLALCNHVRLASGSEVSDVTAIRLSLTHYGDPCKRKVHDYLLQEVSKPCVPVLTVAELKLLQKAYDESSPHKRPFLRFALVDSGVTFLGHEVVAPKFVILDADPSTYPDGFIPGTGYQLPHVLYTKNEAFDPFTNSVHAYPVI